MIAGTFLFPNGSAWRFCYAVIETTWRSSVHITESLHYEFVAQKKKSSHCELIVQGNPEKGRSERSARINHWWKCSSIHGAVAGMTLQPKSMVIRGANKLRLYVQYHHLTCTWEWQNYTWMDGCHRMSKPKYLKAARLFPTSWNCWSRLPRNTITYDLVTVDLLVTRFWIRSTEVVLENQTF